MFSKKAETPLMTRKMILALGFVSTFFVAALSHAEIAPEYYDQMRAAAPEVLVVHVLDAKTAPAKNPAYNLVTITARVEMVEKSASQTKPHDTITIEYALETRDHPNGWTGPAPLFLLKKEENYRAFLKKEGQIYSPAARGHSFSVNLPKKS
jgi:hypothetical protein